MGRFFFFFALLFAVGCIRRGGDESAARSPRLRWMAAAEPTDFDPARCRDRECLQHATLTLDGLFRVDRAGTAVPSLAESWSWSDPKTLVIVLKRGLAWSDGEPVTAARFVDRWRFLVRHCHEFPAAEGLLEIIDARAVCAGAAEVRLGVVARNERTLELRVQRPRPLLPLALAQPATWLARDTLTAGRAVALGPFRLERRDASGWHYGRNRGFHGTATTVGGIDMVVLAAPGLRLQAFREAGADLVDNIPPSLINSAPAAHLEPAGTLRVLLFHPLRRDRSPGNGRRWLAGAVDRQELVRLARWPFAPADRLLALRPGAPPETAASAPPQLPGSSADWERVRTELLRSGVRLSISAEGSDEMEIALGLQAQWLRRLDVKVEIVPPKTAGTTMTLLTLSEDRLQPARRLETILAAIAPDLSPSHRRRLEELGAAIASADSPRALGLALEEAEKALVADGLALPLFVDMRPALVAPTWKDLGFDGFGLWDARFARVGY